MCFRGEWQKGHDCSFGNNCGSCPDWNIIDAVLILSTAMLTLCVSEYKDTYISKTGENSDCATRRIPIKMSTVDSIAFTGESHRFSGFWYTFRSPGDAAALWRFITNLLLCAAPPTHEQPDFAESKSKILRPGGTQNPPVLLPPETVCSARKHPLSSVSGRRRYNTLDFPTENRVATGRFHPYWKPQNQRNLQSLWNPSRFEICIYKPWKRCLHLHIPKRKNPRSIPSDEERKDCGDIDAHSQRKVKIHASHITAIISIRTFHFTRSSQVPFSESYQTEQRTLSQ